MKVFFSTPCRSDMMRHDETPGAQVASQEISSACEKSILHREIGKQRNGAISLADATSQIPG